MLALSLSLYTSYNKSQETSEWLWIILSSPLPITGSESSQLVRLVHAKSDPTSSWSTAEWRWQESDFDKIDGSNNPDPRATNHEKDNLDRLRFSYPERGTRRAYLLVDADGQHKIWDIFRLLTNLKSIPNTYSRAARAFWKCPLRSASQIIDPLLACQQTGVARDT